MIIVTKISLYQTCADEECKEAAYVGQHTTGSNLLEADLKYRRKWGKERVKEKKEKKREAIQKGK
jgi:hypothetical protein